MASSWSTIISTTWNILLCVIMGRYSVCATIEGSFEVKVRQSVKLSCPYKTQKGIQTRWYYSKTEDGTPHSFIPSHRFVTEYKYSNSESILDFKRTDKRDTGYYSYRQDGVFGELFCVFFLDILYSTSAHCTQKVVNAKEMSAVKLSCIGKGNPAPTLHWYRRSLDGKRTEDLGIKGDTLILHNVTRYASGGYLCTADNGEYQSECETKLSVEFYPELEVFETEIVLTETRDVTLICRVMANPIESLRVHWTKGHNFDSIRVNARYGIYEDREQMMSHFTLYSLLTLKAVELGEDMFDTYWCSLLGFEKVYSNVTVIDKLGEV